MLNSDIEKFLTMASQDPALTTQLNAGQAVSDAASAEAFIRGVVASAQKLGISFTEAEFQQWLQAQVEQSSSEELSDDELESVAGGAVVGASYIQMYFRPSAKALASFQAIPSRSNQKL